MKLTLILPLLAVVFGMSHAKDVIRGNGGRLLHALQEEVSMSMSMPVDLTLSVSGIELTGLEVSPANKKSSKSSKCMGTKLSIKIKTDGYPEETNAIITDLCKNADGPFETRVGLPLTAFLYDDLSEEDKDNFDKDQFDDTEHEVHYCLPKSKYSLTVFDDYGDGFNDDVNDVVKAGYKMFVDGTPIGEGVGDFGYEDTVKFGDCPKKKSSKSGKSSKCMGTELGIKIKTDDYPRETNAIITDLCKNPDGPFETRVGLPLIAFLYDDLSEEDKDNFDDDQFDDTEHKVNYCLPKSKYSLTMFDDYGDGFGDDDDNVVKAGYKVFVDGTPIGEGGGDFGHEDTVEFGDCPYKKSSK